MKYKAFIFKDYQFDKTTKSLHLKYAFDDQLEFEEIYRFDFDFAHYEPQTLDRACQLLFFLAGVSYYKAYLAPEIKIEAGQIDASLARFLSKTYRKGLGEFFYVNQLPPATPIDFPINSESLDPLKNNGKGLLVGIGGGKDSLVSTELLRGRFDDIATWSVGHQKQLSPLIERIGLEHYWVERQIDPRLMEANNDGALNGHVPISAILAAAGAVLAVLSGGRDIVVSNEASANEPTLKYEGESINHQYSKSAEFEADFQNLLNHCFDDTMRYYSLLRPLSELRIAEMFSAGGFDKYHDVFSSCNRAFTHDSPGLYWDGKCPKCAFVFLILTPFIDRQKLLDLFGGKNLLMSDDLEMIYKNLLGIEGNKPLDCVGEIKESRSAMDLCKQIYPGLSKYDYEIPADYDYKKLGPHLIPADIWDILKEVIV